MAVLCVFCIIFCWFVVFVCVTADAGNEYVMHSTSSEGVIFFDQRIATAKTKQCSSDQISYFTKTHTHMFSGLLTLTRFLATMQSQWGFECNATFPAVVLDVGANQGQNLKYLFDEFGPGAGCANTVLHLFEPFSRVIKKLKQQMVATKWRALAHLHRHALSNVSGVMSFAVPKKSNPEVWLQLSHLTNEKEKYKFVVQKVPVMTLDSFFDGVTLSQVPFMKIDTEGFDGRVLQGARRTLKYVNAIVFECSDLMLTRGGQTLKEVTAFLRRQGFHTFKIGEKLSLRLDPPYWNDIYEPSQWADCLAVRRNSAALKAIRVLC